MNSDKLMLYMIYRLSVHIRGDFVVTKQQFIINFNLRFGIEFWCELCFYYALANSLLNDL